MTHHVSVIVIQAGAGLRAIRQRPHDARVALEAIDASGRLALTDMRRMLGVLGEGESQEPCPGWIASATSSRRCARRDWRSSSAFRRSPTAGPGSGVVGLPHCPGGPDELVEIHRRRSGSGHGSLRSTLPRPIHRGRAWSWRSAGGQNRHMPGVGSWECVNEWRCSAAPSPRGRRPAASSSKPATNR